MKEIGQLLGLPLNKVNPSQKRPAKQHWETTSRKLWVRFNSAAFSAYEFKDLKPAERRTIMNVTDEELIAAFTTD